MRESAENSLGHLLKVTRAERGGYFHWADNLASGPDVEQFQTAGEQLGLLERQKGEAHILVPTKKGREILDELFG